MRKTYAGTTRKTIKQGGKRPVHGEAVSIFGDRRRISIPDRRSQELKLPVSVDGVARSNQASLLELCSWLKREKMYTKQAVFSHFSQ